MSEREDAFEQQRERIRLAEEALRLNLILLKNISGADASLVLLYNVRNAGMGSIAEVVETLMACVDALSSRVTILEQNSAL